LSLVVRLLEVLEIGFGRQLRRVEFFENLGDALGLRAGEAPLLELLDHAAGVDHQCLHISSVYHSNSATQGRVFWMIGFSDPLRFARSAQDHFYSVVEVAAVVVAEAVSRASAGETAVASLEVGGVVEAWLSIAGVEEPDVGQVRRRIRPITTSNITAPRVAAMKSPVADTGMKPNWGRM
jgi:hypothetical protein